MNSHLYVSLHIMVEANDYQSRRETPSSTNFLGLLLLCDFVLFYRSRTSDNSILGVFDKRVINVFVCSLGSEKKLVREHFHVFWSVFLNFQSLKVQK